LGWTVSVTCELPIYQPIRSPLGSAPHGSKQILRNR